MVFNLISFTVLVILDELTEVLEAYMASEVFVHDLKLYLAASIALTFDSLHPESQFDLVFSNEHALWISRVALCIALEERIVFRILAVVLLLFHKITRPRGSIVTGIYGNIRVFAADSHIFCFLINIII